MLHACELDYLALVGKDRISPQLLLKFRHKKGASFSLADGHCSSGFISDLDPGLQSTVVVGKPPGYLPDGNTQPSVLRDFSVVSFADSRTVRIV